MENKLDPKLLSESFYYHYVLGRSVPETEDELKDFLISEGANEENIETLLNDIQKERERVEGRNLFKDTPVTGGIESIKAMGRGLR